MVKWLFAQSIHNGYERGVISISANEFHLLQLLQIIAVQNLRICIARNIEEATYENVTIKISFSSFCLLPLSLTNIFILYKMYKKYLSRVKYYKLFFNYLNN